MNMRFIFFVLYILVSTALWGQNTLALGDWAQFSSFRTSNYVTGGDGLIFYSNTTGVVIVHEDNSISYLTKVEGLSSVDISSIFYHDALDILIIGYENGNVDLYENGEITNLNDIKINLTIQQSRRIKNMVLDDAGLVYLSTDFGIVVLDPIEGTFPSTIFTPQPVNQVVQFQDYLYAALDNGLYRVDQEANIIDFSNWELLDQSFGLPNDYSSTVVTRFNNKIYVGVDDDIFSLDISSGEAKLEFGESGFTPVYIYSGKEQVFIGLSKVDINGDESKGKTIGINTQGQIESSSFSCVDRPAYMYEDASGLLWFADEFDILRNAPTLSSRCNAEELNTPLINDVQDVKIIDNNLYVTVGGANDNFTYSNKQQGTLVRKEGIWDAYNKFTRADELPDVRDHYQIEQNEEGGNIFISTAYAGLIEFDQNMDQFTVHNETNSPLRSVNGDIPERVRIFGIGFDSQENLWMTNFNTSSPIKMLRPDGTWESFNPRNVDQRLSFMVVDQNDNIWASVESTGDAVAVMNFGDPSTTSDDQIRVFNSTNSEIQNNRVRSLAVDRDGAVWIGTDKGVVIFNCSDPFDDNCLSSRPLVQQADGFLDFLLSNEVVNTITIDPANRKWLGTNNGIFLQSASGDEEIEHFTEDNSPLFTNRVVELEMDSENGVLYIGTERGLMAYRSDAIEGGVNHSSSVIAFPNPVRPDYDGPIAITGLADDSNVKIANINGQLVFETKSLGGQAVWDGKDFSGRRVSSGVYYVFAATNSFFGGSDGALTKILVMH